MKRIALIVFGVGLACESALFADGKVRSEDIHITTQPNKTSHSKTIEAYAAVSTTKKPKSFKSPDPSVKINRHKQRGENSFPEHLRRRIYHLDLP